jgi:hypothetical protein
MARPGLPEKNTSRTGKFKQTHYPFLSYFDQALRASRAIQTVGREAPLKARCSRVGQLVRLSMDKALGAPDLYQVVRILNERTSGDCSIAC